MHARNPYRTPPDFVALAEVYPALRDFLINVSTPSSSSKSGDLKMTVNFKDEKSLRCLTEAIMYRDFGLKLAIPEDRLCPPIPNRLNYVLWIQDIVYYTRKMTPNASGDLIRGIDIGTGATAIYPLLACTLDKNWQMIGTEIDDVSFDCALDNVHTNNIQDRISICKASREGYILFLLQELSNDTTAYDFTMCNPPFYSSAEEVAELARSKDGPPNAACTGSENEMIFLDGGEVGFVGKMIEESMSLKGRCRWYTSMLGRLSSVAKIVQLLRVKSINNYAVTEFIQGQTRRWAIGWSFLDTRLPDTTSRILSHPSHPLNTSLPPRNNLVRPSTVAKGRRSQLTQEDILKRLKEALGALEGVRITEYNPEVNDIETPKSRVSLLVEADGNSWSRSARRKRRKLNPPGEDLPIPRGVVSTPMMIPVMICQVLIVSSASLNAEENHSKPQKEDNLAGSYENLIFDKAVEKWTERPDIPDIRGGHCVVDLPAGEFYLEFQWVYGKERALFEGFVSHIGSKVGALG